jgi:hypothetical protein
MYEGCQFIFTFEIIMKKSVVALWNGVILYGQYVQGGSTSSSLTITSRRKNGSYA